MTTIATKYPFIGSIETNQGGRSENQDNAGFVDTPLGLLLVVCDGMGGGPGGRTASLIAVDTILTLLSDVSEHTPRDAALKFAINKANDFIYTKAKENPELRGMGTTVAAILINEDSAFVAHAGDTRIYQLRKGTIVFRSSDHSVVASLVKQKKITEEEARNHPQSNIVTRALGIRPGVEIDLDEVAFHRGDRFVICTDGIWGMMPQRDLVKSLSRVMGISELTTLITDEIDEIGKRYGGGHDNLTLAIVDASFNSGKKVFPKKSTKDDDAVPELKSNKFYGWIKLIFLILCLIGAIFMFSYLNIPRTKSDKIQNDNHFSAKDKITILVNEDTSVIETKDSDALIQDFTEQRVSPIHEEDVANPFQDTAIIIGQKKEIVRQINHVVKNLDSLKKMKGKNQKSAQNEKQKFVKRNIEPNVNDLGGKVVKEKRYEIKAILKMLNDKKTIQSSPNGQATPASKQHIELIKIKVKGLQD